MSPSGTKNGYKDQDSLRYVTTVIPDQAQLKAPSQLHQNFFSQNQKSLRTKLDLTKKMKSLILKTKLMLPWQTQINNKVHICKKYEKR
jgi:hypothetical protein